MAGIYGYSREAVRVKVKKCETNAPPEWRKFSVDPQITSLEVLYSILAKAFDIKSDFGISYKTLDPCGQETYLGVLSDWDLDAAFLRAHNLSIQTGNEPCLNLRVDIKAFSEATDWEVNSPATKEVSPFQQSLGVGQKYVQNMQNKLPGLIMNQMAKTFSMVQQALNLMDDQLPAQPPRPPLSDSEFRNFLDSVGQIIQPNELRKVIFSGGIDPSLRRVVWKHILNVYPFDMTGRERMDYMKRKATEYYRLRDNWRSAVQRGPVIGELAYVTSMVRKDVLRTDRLHPFYAGSDDNQNIASLFNILTTYALNHPSVSYCQGMSDIASPLLVTMGDEAHAYICFCAIMLRLKGNFMLDGIAMTQKFTHLSEALQYYDPEFYEYLKAQQADDLLFCYRWLLLEMKREFPFEDSLRMLEVLWSSMRTEPPSKELDLVEKEFELPPQVSPPKSPSVMMRTPRENPYTKVCALRRQSSSISLLSNSPNQSTFLDSPLTSNKLDATKRMNQSLDENISRISNTKRVTKAHQSLDETKMLMLMENISSFETLPATTKPYSSNSDNINKIETTGIATSIDDNAAQIIFHPTNPFIDDAQHLQQLQTLQRDNSIFLENENERYLMIDDGNNHEATTINVINMNNNHGNLSQSPKKDSMNNKSAVHHNNKITFQKNSMKLTNKTIFSCAAVKQINNKKGGHFKDLKEKIAASKKGILASLEKIENQNFNDTIIKNATSGQNNTMAISQQILVDECAKISKSNNKNNQKIVKNFNEFLNFAAINKSRISDKLVTNNKIQQLNEKNDSATIGSKETILIKHLHHNLQHQPRPLIKLTKHSFDDSDSSTIDVNSVATSITSQSIQSIATSTSQDQHPVKPALQLHLTNIVAQTQMTLDGSSPDDSQDYYPMTTSMTRELRLELENLDRQVFGEAGIIERNNKLLNDNCSEIGYEKLGKDSLDLVEVREEEIVLCPNVNDLILLRNNSEMKKNIDPLKRISACSTNTDIFIWENPLHQMSGASSCNFNDDIIESNGEDENAIRSYTNGNVENEQLFNNAMTPDEQQDLEYDGDIVLECLGEDSRKSITTPLRLVQQKATNSRIRDDSDSENTDSWKQNENNPFLIGSGSLSNNILSPLHDFRDMNSFIEEQENTLTSEISHNHLQHQSSIGVNNPQLGEEAAEANIISFTKTNNILPPPHEFGGGNPFLMFLCLTLLLQHRNFVMKSGMDYNEMAMHFDKMIRKHEVSRVLNQARRMYGDYLKTQNALAKASCSLSNNDGTTDAITKS